MKRIKTYELFEDKREGAPLSKVQIDKIPFFYHATDKSNYDDILDDGIKVGVENVVYMSDSFEHAAIFLAFRGKPIVAFKIDASKLDKKKIHESFDHSYEFFQCRAFVYEGDISNDAIDIENIMSYNDETH